jgi:class 3 adenylate cyclase
MRIRTKLTSLMLGIGVIGVAGSAAVSAWHLRRGLVSRVEDQLTSVRQSKRYQIEAYFQNVRNQILTMSESVMFVEGSKELREAYFALDRLPVAPAEREAVRGFYVDTHLPQVAKLMDLRLSMDEYMPVFPAPHHLQAIYIVRNPYPFGKRSLLDAANNGTPYDRVHSRFHPSYRRIAEVFGYHDLMIIDQDTLRIVYTVAKDVELGTSLARGPYRETGLAGVVAKCRDDKGNDAVHFADFESYEPSRGAPTAFLCSPIAERKGKRTGILVIQLKLDEIDNVVSGNRGWLRDGLGKTGDSGIVGADYLMRSTARRFVEDPEGYIASLRARNYPEKKIERMKAYGTTILQQEVRLPSVERALAGQEGVMRQIGSSGGGTLVAYGPLDVMGVHWTLASRMDEQEALAPVFAARRQLLWLLLSLLTLTLLIAFLLSRSVVAKIHSLADAANRVRRGDLTARAPVSSTDELGNLASTFNYMADSIERKTEQVERKNRENEALLLNILPGPIAARLKEGESVIADQFAEVTVLFGDLVGFTAMSGERPPAEVVDLLNDLFSRFDMIAQRLGVEKIKTIGDAYMAVAGLPTACPDHVRRILKMALEMTEEMRRFSAAKGHQTQLRIGINSGPVVAGVIGATKFIYDLWGDTVNIASRMESNGVPGAIQVTRPVYEALKDEYEFEYRGSIEVKGKGHMEAWLVKQGQPVHA